MNKRKCSINSSFLKNEIIGIRNEELSNINSRVENEKSKNKSSLFFSMGSNVLKSNSNENIRYRNSIFKKKNVEK